MNWVDDELTSLQERFIFNALPLFASRKNKDEHCSGSSNDQQQQGGEYQQAWLNRFLPVVVVAVLLFLAQRRALFYYYIGRFAKIITTVRRETCDDGSHSNNIRSSSSHGQPLPNAEPLQIGLLDQRFDGEMSPAIIKNEMAVAGRSRVITVRGLVDIIKSHGQLPFPVGPPEVYPVPVLLLTWAAADADDECCRDESASPRFGEPAPLGKESVHEDHWKTTDSDLEEEQTEISVLAPRRRPPPLPLAKLT
jgi:hypothetical protein